MESTKQPAQFIVRDALLVTMDEQRNVFESGYVWVKDGLVHQVGDSAALRDLPAEVKMISARGRLIMPGLVNAHGHLSNGILRGLYDEMPLSVWFSKGMWPVLEALSREDGRIGAELALLEQMTTGVTTTVSAEFGVASRDMPDGVLEAIHASGVRAVVSRMTVDNPNSEDVSQAVPLRFCERPQDAVAEVERLQRTWNSELVSVGAEALGVLRCTPAMIEAMHDVAVRTGSHFLMHVASSREEHEDTLRQFGHGSVAELNRMGVLGPRTLLAHTIWLSDEEIAMLARSQTGISHNPVANAYYASGVARLAELLEAGVRVGLGVDGASTNNAQNVWETMKMALLFQKERRGDAGFGSAELALELMTRGGAAALHMEDRIGSLEPGKQADFIVIDPERVALAPAQTLISNLVYSNDPYAVRDVYVAGRAVVVDGEHQLIDREQTLARAREALERVLVRSGLKSYLATRGKWRWHGVTTA
jgi:5-methylthioadenosine/S-adenosylhomocysteine deaminase